MSIPISKYVAITTATAKLVEASKKDLIPRIFTTNPLFAANTVYEFTSSSDVAAFAGALSAEAKFASEYFGWVSKKARKPQKLSFIRYSFEALAPYLYSTKQLTPLATFKAITNGSMNINLGGTEFELKDIDLSNIEAYADVATVIQAAIRTNTDGGALWTNATVAFNPSNSSFELTGGETGVNSINFASATSEGVDLSSLLGWDVASAPVLSDGTAEQSVTDTLNKTIDISSNFLTFGFLNPSDAYSNLDLISSWTAEQNFNYRFCFDLGASNYQEGIQTASKYSGLTAHYNINYGITGLNPAWIMSAILPATTNYDSQNAVKNYMFQEFPAQPIAVGVNDGNLYQTLDKLLINYNGQTQKSGKTLAFYQNGFNTDGVDTAVFDNEAWLKDSIATDILNTMLGLDFISADKDGEAILSGILEDNAEKALTNHVFANGKVLTTAEKAYITQLTGDENTWLDVQNNGYYKGVEIVPQTQGDSTIYVGEYTLIYMKNDVIRKVTGSNILI